MVVCVLCVDHMFRYTETSGSGWTWFSSSLGHFILGFLKIYKKTQETKLHFLLLITRIKIQDLQRYFLHTYNVCILFVR